MRATVIVSCSILMLLAIAVVGTRLLFGAPMPG
jgi:hypothetical protein